MFDQACPLISFQTLHGPGYAKANLVQQILPTESGSIVCLSCGEDIPSTDKSTAIAARVKAATEKVPDPPVPNATPDPDRGFREIPSPRGKFSLSYYPGTAVAWLSPSGKNDQTGLGLVSERNGDYIQYRDHDSTKNLPRFALSVDQRGHASVQVLLRGEAPEMSRLRNIPLDTLLGLIARHQENPEYR